MKFLAIFLLLSTAACAQNSSDAFAPIERKSATPSEPAITQKPEDYAPRALLLIDARPGTEAVMPMIFTEGGKQQIEFIAGSKIKESMDKGGRPIRLGDVLVLLGQQTQKITQLQEENAKLWQAVTNGNPRTQTVVVQPVQTGPSPEELAEQRREADMEDANARRQQMIQAWRIMQRNTNQTQTINLNYRNCTRFPALCVGR